MGIKFEFFEAGCGDSILVSTDEGTNILIDGGVSYTYNNEIVYSISELDKLDLVVLTHIDNDHICGIIELINDKYNRKKIKKLWFNSASEDLIFKAIYSDDVALGQGSLLTRYLKDFNIPYENNIYVKVDNIYQIGTDIKLTLLSPHKKNLDSLRKKWKKYDTLRDCSGKIIDISGEKNPIDKREISNLINDTFANETSYTNKSSIAFILEYKEQRFLFLGDADIKVVVKTLKSMGYNVKNNRLTVKFVKLSHHGSKNNISNEFLDLVQTDKFIILTDGLHPNRPKDKPQYKHPDKEALSLILMHPKRERDIEFIFNHDLPIDKKFPREMNEERRYNFEAYRERYMRFE